MTVRCPDCGATLRVKQERIGSRTHGTCPSCRAAVPLKPAEERIQVLCTHCGTMLKAPASSTGMQGRCPKCRTAIAIGRAATQTAAPGNTKTATTHAPAPHAPATHTTHHDAHDAESSVSTQRISVRTLGLETMAASASVAGTTTAGKATTGHATTTGKGTATSLLDAPAPALTTAAEEIKSAARGIAHAPAGSKKTESPAAPARTLAEILEQRERDNDEHMTATSGRKAFSTFQGVLCGVTSGAIVGATWGLVGSRFEAETIETFLATPPAFFAGLGLPGGFLAIVLTALLGGTIGLLTALTEPEGGTARPAPRFVRSAGFGLVAGLLMAALWFFNSGNPGNVAGLTPAFNWIRDMMVTGIVTGFLVHLFARSRT